jgi:hypothetical protein
MIETFIVITFVLILFGVFAKGLVDEIFRDQEELDK